MPTLPPRGFSLDIESTKPGALTLAQRQARADNGGCDCADPECTLTAGRCYLCGNPHAHCSGTFGLEFTVCPQCAPAVQALYDREAALLPVLARVGFEDRGAEGPAWAPFDGAADGAFCIQRDDYRDHFESDDEAAAYVAKRLGLTMTYPEGA